MRIPLAGQLAAAFAVPIVALVLVAGSAPLGFAQLDSAKQELAAKGGLRAKVQHVAGKITQLRFATRGYVLTGKSRHTTERIEAIDAARLDIAYIVAHAALLPGIAAETQRFPVLVEGINTGCAEIEGLTRSDRDAVMGFYFKGRKTGRYAPTAAEFRKVNAGHERASKALEKIGNAIATTASVAEGLTVRAEEMRSASTSVTETMASASAAVEENAAAASEMRSTSAHITNVMVPSITVRVPTGPVPVAFRLGPGTCSASFTRGLLAPVCGDANGRS